MIFNHQHINEEYPKTIISINNTPVENNTIFKYLGRNIKYDKPSTGDRYSAIHAHRYSAMQVLWARENNDELKNNTLCTRENHIWVQNGFFARQQRNFIARVIRGENNRMTKCFLFNGNNFFNEFFSRKKTERFMILYKTV